MITEFVKKWKRLQAARAKVETARTEAKEAAQTAIDNGHEGTELAEAIAPHGGSYRSLRRLVTGK